MKLKYYSRITYIFILGVFTCLQIRSQTIISDVEVSGVWTESSSPYMIDTNLLVPDGETLIIEPGVEVIFNNNYNIKVKGRLLAIGSESDSILFTALDSSGLYNKTNIGWSGIHLDTISESNDTSKFKYCIFRYTNNDNGAISIWSTSIVSIQYSTFLKNVSLFGGGISLYNSYAEILNNSFNDNRPFTGGGIWCDNSNAKILNNIFRGNIAEGTGGAISIQSSNCHVLNNQIIGNSAWSGGGIYLGRDECEPIIHGNLISNNAATWGSGLYITSANPQIFNNIICNNLADDYTIFITSHSSARMVNNTIVNNDYTDIIGATIGTTDSLILYNSILWGNKPNERGGIINIGQLGICEIQNCIVEGLENDQAVYPNCFHDCMNIIPQFLNPSAGIGVDYNGFEANWMISNSSPAINTGTLDTSGLNLPQYDFAGSPRISPFGSPIIDIGAYEYQDTLANTQPVIYELSDQSIYPGNIMRIIISFIDVDTSDKHIIRVISGSDSLQVFGLTGDTTNSTFNLKAHPDWKGSTNVTVIVTDDSGEQNNADTSIFICSSGCEICGLVRDDLRLFLDTTKVTCNVIIDSSVEVLVDPGSVIQFMGDYHISVNGTMIAKGDPQDTIKFTTNESIGWTGILFKDFSENSDSSIIEYCIIENINNPGGSIDHQGAISAVQYNKLRISNCLIKNNSVTWYGGAIYCRSSDILIVENKFSENSSQHRGGAIYSELSSPKILSNQIFGNYAKERGGGILLKQGAGVIMNNYISLNRSQEGGGMAIIQCENPIINGNMIYSNVADNGGGIVINNSGGILSNNTVTQNIAEYAAGLDLFNVETKIVNSIFWNNVVTEDGPGGDVNIYNQDSSPEFHDNIISSNFSVQTPDRLPDLALNNIISDPKFHAPDTYNFDITAESPCRNMGTIDTIGLSLLKVDIYGNPRIFESRIDIGAAEYTDVNSSISEFISNDLIIYPNPTTGMLNLSSNADVRLVEIYDIHGRLLERINENFNQITLENKGVSLVRIIMPERTIVKKVFKY